VGVGPANFEATIYRYRSRAFARTPRQAHQLTLEVLAERGIVGAALLATVLGAITWSSLRARRRIAGDRQLVLLTGLVGSCSVWIVHVQLDWTWQITAATLPAVLGAGCLLGAARWAEAAPERGERSSSAPQVPGCWFRRSQRNGRCAMRGVRWNRHTPIKPRPLRLERPVGRRTRLRRGCCARDRPDC
jgi:hypothetical protein